MGADAALKPTKAEARLIANMLETGRSPEQLALAIAIKLSPYDPHPTCRGIRSCIGADHIGANLELVSGFSWEVCDDSGRILVRCRRDPGIEAMHRDAWFAAAPAQQAVMRERWTKNRIHSDWAS
jgi:hypothetical protein